MLILGFDTTGPHGGAALGRDGESLGEERAEGKANYSVALFEMVDRLLARAGLRLADVDLFAAATGPGSFTGIRVGLAAAQGWAKAFGRPVRGVSIFEAMVAQADPTAGTVVPLLDARRGEFYVGVFRSERHDEAGEHLGRGWKPAGEGMVLDPAHIAALAQDLLRGPGPGVAFIAHEHDEAVPGLRSVIPEAVQWITVPSSHAGAIARVALQAFHEGRVQGPDELDACYIRRSDAELNWRE